MTEPDPVYLEDNFEHLSTADLVKLNFAELLLCFVLLASNTFILLVIAKSELWVWRQNVFIIHLVLCDMVRGSATLVRGVYDLVVSSQPPLQLCQFWSFVITATTAIDTLAIPLLLYDRLLFVLAPITYIHRMTRKLIIFLLVYNTSQGFCIAILPVLGWGKYIYIPDLRTCDVDWINHIDYQIFSVIWLYFLPIIGSCFCYAKLLVMLKRRLCQVKTVNSHTLRIYTVKTGNDNKPSGIDASLQSTAKLLLVLLVAYVGSWTPWMIYNISVCIKSVRHHSSSPKLYYMWRTFSLVTSTVNPWLYGLYNKRFRKTMKAMLQCAHHRRADTPKVLVQSQPGLLSAPSELSSARSERSMSLMGLNDYPLDGSSSTTSPVSRIESLQTSQVTLRMHNLTASYA